MRRAEFDGDERGDRPSRPGYPEMPVWDGRVDEGEPLAAAANEIALGVWVCASVLGIAFGLLVASLAQVWARSVLAPGAVLGAGVVVASLGATLAAVGRYRLRGAVPPRPGGSSRALATASVFVVGALAWVALAVIFATGWDFPASLFARAARGDA